MGNLVASLMSCINIAKDRDINRLMWGLNISIASIVHNIVRGVRMPRPTYLYIIVEIDISSGRESIECPILFLFYGDKQTVQLVTFCVRVATEQDQ